MRIVFKRLLSFCDSNGSASPLINLMQITRFSAYFFFRVEFDFYDERMPPTSLTSFYEFHCAQQFEIIEMSEAPTPIFSECLQSCRYEPSFAKRKNQNVCVCVWHCVSIQMWQPKCTFDIYNIYNVEF